MEKVLTYEEIDKKWRRREPLTSPERLILLVNQIVSYKKADKQNQFKRGLLEVMIEKPNYTEEEKNALKIELSRMSMD